MPTLAFRFPLSEHVAVGDGHTRPTAEPQSKWHRAAWTVSAGTTINSLNFLSAHTASSVHLKKHMLFDKLIAHDREIRSLAVVDTLGRRDLILASPLFVEVLVALEEVSVVHRQTGVFGIGDSHGEALSDFRAAVVELYETLREERDRLGPAMLEKLALLESVIRTA